MESYLNAVFESFRLLSGLLRYKVDFQSMQLDELDTNEFFDLDEY